MYPHLNPIVFKIGPLAVHWYGIMYLVGFAGAWLLCQFRAKNPARGWTANQVNDLIFYSACGVIIGGRLGYMLFYDFPSLIANPLTIFAIWTGGMSFHGGMIGVVVSFWIFARRNHKSFLTVGDFLAPAVSFGLGAGRIGNFINGELWGRVTDVPWGMIFPALGPPPRHPSVVYEFLLEGVLLFLILWIYSAKPRPTGAVSGLFLICYGVFRIIIEFFRQPDPQLGFVALGWVTMGQVLSIPMVILGIGLMAWAYKHKNGNVPQEKVA